GWAMETHLRTELVLAALEMAIGQRNPSNVIHHSDQRRNTIFVGLSGDTGDRPRVASRDTRRVHFDGRVSPEARDLASLFSTMLVAEPGQA
ncbi:MAG TPA: hypothetical protein VJS43_17830, partial [Candidatus Acidoferrales bacterium]|nr:hypothetical protein [Candidatus Acidoferrales bacterium]